jgi:homoserine O-acetyltransferase
MKSISKIIILCFFVNVGICKAQNNNVSIPDSRQQLASLNDFKLESGAVIQDCVIGYRTYGHLNSNKTNGILFPTWFMGTAKDIEQYQAPWKVIDTTKYFLIIVDALGDGVSSSPSNSIKQPGAHFPVFSIRDMIESQYQLLTQTLHIKHLNTIIGLSMGGFQTFQWGISYPDFSSRLIPIVGSPQLDGYDLMHFNIIREIIEADTAFNHGNYKSNPIIVPAAMFIAFDLTTPTYMSKTIQRDAFYPWLQGVYKGKNADWNNTYYQLLAILGQDIAKSYNGSLQEAANHIKAKMLIITSRQDHMLSPAPAINFSKLLPAKLVILDSEMGHFAPNFDDPQEKQGIIDILTKDE